MDTSFNPTARRDVPQGRTAPRREGTGDGHAGAFPVLAGAAGLAAFSQDGRSPARVLADAQWAHAELGRLFRPDAHKALGYVLGFGLNASFKTLTFEQLSQVLALGRAVAAPHGVVERALLVARERVADTWGERVNSTLPHVRFALYVDEGRRLGLSWTLCRDRVRVLAFAPVGEGSLIESRRVLRAMTARAVEVLGEIDEARRAEVLA